MTRIHDTYENQKILIEKNKVKRKKTSMFDKFESLNQGLLKVKHKISSNNKKRRASKIHPALNNDGKSKPPKSIDFVKHDIVSGGGTGQDD